MGAQLAVGGTVCWALAKAIKRVYSRPRPSSLIESVPTRGLEASGLGHVSEHAGVAVALGVTAFGDLSRAGRIGTLIAAPTIGLCRICVGAHLPLDVLGGAAMGLAVEPFVNRILG